jgi:GAF domain-containing protein
MAEKNALLAEQLRLACKTSGARWLAWIYPNPVNRLETSGTPGWQVGMGEGLSKTRLKALLAFINQPARQQWVSGALASGRPRWQDVGPNQQDLGCGRIYLYPRSVASGEQEAATGLPTTLLIAGAEGLNTHSEAILRLVGLTPPNCLVFEPELAPPAPAADRLASEQLEALYATSLEISARLDLATLLQRIALRARELAGARGAEVGLVESHPADKNHPADGENAPGVRLVISETPWEAMQGLFIPSQTGLAGRIAASAASLNVADYNAWDGRLLPERFAPFQAAAGVPLVLDNEVIGTLTVLDDRPGKQFSQSDLHLLEMFAAQAAIAIQTTRLIEALHQRMEAQLRAEKELFHAAQLAAIGDLSTQIANEISDPLRRAATLLELVMRQLPEDTTQPLAQLPGPALRDLRLAYQQALQAREMTQRLLLAAHETRPTLPA